MKKCFLLIALAIITLWSVSYAGNGDKNNNSIQARSQFIDPTVNGGMGTSFPGPFTELGNPVTSPAISTGYYYVDGDDQIPAYWQPTVSFIDTTVETEYWHRINQGPRIVDSTYWINNPDEGLRFFRNPYYPTGNRSFFSFGDVNATDSTDDAFAGPIPLNFGFYFNGIRYDSFYVSTNGLIALTNRRYTYSGGVRTVPPGSQDCYDVMSMDWFQRGGRSGNGISDATVDNFGYQYAVCGNQEKTNALGGIRARAGGSALNVLPQGCAVIAPFWGDGELSQWFATSKRIDDFGKCYYKRDPNGAYLIIYFVNYQIKGTILDPKDGSYTGPADTRFGDKDWICASSEVFLNRLDSSVTILYTDFEGSHVVTYNGSVDATVLFHWNTTVGVRGFARHTNYGQTGGPNLPWAAEYEQYTHYSINYNKTTIPTNADYSNPGDFHVDLTIKFKQWKNCLRVVDIQYRVKPQDGSGSEAFSVTIPTTQVADYELLAGNDILGPIQPVAIIQNLTNQIQGPTGVNFVPQDFDFRARFQISNLATGKIVYNRLVPVDSTCLATCYDSLGNCTGDINTKVRYSTVTKPSGNYTAKNFAPRIDPGVNPPVETVMSPWNINGIPPYGFVQIYFPPYIPNDQVPDQIGRMMSYIIADPTNPRTNSGYGDAWPFDDTTNVRLFVMKTLSDFSDDVMEYHLITENGETPTPMPSVIKWVNIDADVLSGDGVSHYPLPPRGAAVAANYDPVTGNNNETLYSPVIHMNRVTLTGSEPSTAPGGDQIRSFPINLLNPVPRYRSTLSVSFQRGSAGNVAQWPRDWCDNELVNPEPRTMFNTNPLVRWATSYYTPASSPGDEIDIEFAQPTQNGVNYITNIPDKNWRYHPGSGGRAPITNCPDYALWGSNGYFTGWLENQPPGHDSSLALPSTSPPLFNGYRNNNYDEGVDYFYQKAYVTIPDTIINSKYSGASFFRFRIHVMAANDGNGFKYGCLTCIPDDNDDFYVDNVRLLFPSEITDLEVTAVSIQWPYTLAPASQATQIPVTVRVSNNTGIAAGSFLINVRIFPGQSSQVIPQWQQWFNHQNDSSQFYPQPKAVYCRRITIPMMTPNLEKQIAMPAWNARASGDGNYTLLAYLTIPGMDLEPIDDTTYSDVHLTFGNYFAYDPVTGAQNDVPSATQVIYGGLVNGRGLNLSAFQEGGVGYSQQPEGGWKGDYECGTTGGDASGQIAMKFELLASDTIYGYQAFWGDRNQSEDDISFEIYSDASGAQPSVMFPSSEIYRQRGTDDVTGKIQQWNTYITALLPKGQPVILGQGTYWMAIAQLGETGFELGARSYNMGMRTTNFYINPNNGIEGTSNYSMMIEKNYRRVNPYDNSQLLNNNFFAAENTKGSGAWMQFMPSDNNPCYAHMDGAGTSPADGATYTAARGTWLPMIHPYFGPRSSGKLQDAYQDCTPVPVELTSFDAVVRNSGIDLFWETASEISCAGFYIERSISGEANFSTIAFINGHGNTNAVHNYDFTDNKVQYGVTYQYRLIQVNQDGTQNCPSTDDITKTMNKVSNLTLLQNRPNPVTTSTLIEFVLPNEEYTKVEILDIFGNVVKTLDANILSAEDHTYNWDGTDVTGTQLSSGRYFCRVSTATDNATIIMTLVR